MVFMIRKRIKILRDKYGKTLETVSLETGLSVKKLSRLERGDTQGNFTDFEKIISKVAITQDDKYFLATGEYLVSSESDRVIKLQEEIEWLKKIIELDRTRPIIIQHTDNNIKQAQKGGQNCDQRTPKSVKSGHT